MTKQAHTTSEAEGIAPTVAATVDAAGSLLLEAVLTATEAAAPLVDDAAAISTAPSATESAVASTAASAPERAAPTGTEHAAPGRIDGIVVGRLVGHDPAGAPLVDFASNPTGKPLAARSLVSLSGEAQGREVALMFDHGNVIAPIVLGLMASVAATQIRIQAGPGGVETEVDDQQIVLTTEKRLVFRCGKASLTLTPAGKIILRGEYVLSRASGVNRIQGGSVQIN